MALEIRKPDTAFALDRSSRSTKRQPWGMRLHEERPGTIKKQCSFCSTMMWLPPSKSDRRFCSSSCQNAHRQVVREAHVRNCETCGNSFQPCTSNLSRGGGRYCSQKCNSSFRAAGNSPEARAKAVETRKKGVSEGRITIPSGEDHHSWRGGKKAARERRRDNGAEAALLRKYRKENPDKVREFSRRRSSRKIDKLPYGTIPDLRSKQRNRCAICGVSVKREWHLDHIMPLAKGGEHKPRNLQILCKSCNLSKSARDPLIHMRSLGRLL